MLEDEFGDLRSACVQENCGLWDWVGGDDKRNSEDCGRDGGGNGEVEEPVHSVPYIQVDGCRIRRQHPLNHFNGLIGRDTIHSRNRRVRETLDSK